MDQSGLYNSQVSFATEQYLQLGIGNEQASFEDSAMIDDETNASPFSRFAADNSYFQKIFSELFLGGSGQDGLNESQNFETNRQPIQQEEKGQRKQNGDEQVKEQSARGCHKQRNAGRRFTAEKIVDDISYLDDDGGIGLYNDVEKLLNQEEKKKSRDDLANNSATQYKGKQTRQNNIAMLNNNRITKAIAQGSISRSTKQQCENFLAQNHFALSDKVLRMQTQIKQERKDTLAINDQMIEQKELKEQDEQKINDLGLHGA